MAVAVRIARAHTQRDKILFCGYHGWHDWYLSANLGGEDALADAAELGALGLVFDQDTANMSRVQLGLKTTRKPGVTLGHYQEVRIRHMHHVLDRYLDAPD